MPCVFSARNIPLACRLIQSQRQSSYPSVWPSSLCDFISYFLSLTQCKPYCPPYCSSYTPNVYLLPGLRFYFPGTLFHQIFSWFYSYLHKIQIDNLFGGKHVWDALKYSYHLNHQVFFEEFPLRKEHVINVKIYRQRYVSSTIYLWILLRSRKYKHQNDGLL